MIYYIWSAYGRWGFGRAPISGIVCTCVCVRDWFQSETVGPKKGGQRIYNAGRPPMECPFATSDVDAYLNDCKQIALNKLSEFAWHVHLILHCRPFELPS